MTLKNADDAFLDSLRNVLPDDVLGGAEGGYFEEPRARFTGRAGAIARPRDTAAVSTILRQCNEAGVPVVPYAGGTGLVGGQVMGEGPVPLLLSLERMTAIRSVDTTDNVMEVKAGAVLASVQEAAADADRLFPLSLASEGSARIGGVLGTNAGGVQVLRYGNARDLCLGIEAVLADGTVFNGMKRLRKDNTGYDLRNLMIGSEGTLGVITAAVLRLYPSARQTVTAVVAVSSPRIGLDVLNLMRDRGGAMLTAFELIHRAGLDFLAETLPDLPVPFPEGHDWYALVEFTSGAGLDLAELGEGALAEGMEQGLILDAVIAQTEAQRTAFWQVRESIPEANRLIGSISSHDISVPVSRIPEFIEAGRAAIRALDPALRINCFGHAGDGNLHYNVFPPQGQSRSDFEGIRAVVKRTVHDLADSFDGSVSAEHGVGRLKAGDLVRYGDPGKLVAMRAIKAALDPNGILNPGAVLGAR
ncbi:MAG: FAD-binding oxidoreductase [Pseudomonadota bacterium]